jgi:hypothetical protein
MGGLMPGGGGGRNRAANWAEPLHRRTPMSKVFLLLFFQKKKILPSDSSSADSFTPC